MRRSVLSVLISPTLAFMATSLSAGEAPDPQAFKPPPPLPVDHRLQTVDPAANAARNAYFGDLHVHTTYSFDAFVFGTLATPRDAYRFARGEAIRHPAGFEVKLREPLDFYAVTDHSEFLGVVPVAADPESEIGKLEFYQPLRNLNAPENMNVESIARRTQGFGTFIPRTVEGIGSGKIQPEQLLDISRDAWLDIIHAAQEFNNPGRFTTFVGYEYTSATDDRGNLHRNVIFRAADRLPTLPFSRLHSQNPEGLWAWMDRLRAEGVESLAIPHNSNGSNGHMFKLTDWAGNPIDPDYSQRRLRNEPLVEITQVKGTSDTHPALSPNDEWADFEIMPYRIATMLYSEPVGSYVRPTLLHGLELEQAGAGNPYQFGFVGASDTHTGAISEDESNFFAKIGILDSTGVLRGSVPIPPEQLETLHQAGAKNLIKVEGREYFQNATASWGAAGLAAVWAEENTRAAIYDAFRRKETFATSGPRIRVRFFGGFDFPPDLPQRPDMVQEAYRTGVSMGSDLIARDDEVPSFLVWATRDARSAALQRLQVVKGYLENGKGQERVYDVACSDGLKVDPQTHRCPDNGAKVNLADCSVSQGAGASELKVLWRDPDFRPEQRAFYYVRVLENPTCRWSTWDAVRAGVEPRADLKKTIQERAWSSPIWYAPKEVVAAAVPTPGADPHQGP